MTYALILYACTAGSNCPPMVLSDQIPSQFECMSSPRTQATIAEFLADRPNWRVERFVCADVKRLGFYLGRNSA